MNNQSKTLEEYGGNEKRRKPTWEICFAFSVSRRHTIQAAKEVQECVEKKRTLQIIRMI